VTEPGRKPLGTAPPTVGVELVVVPVVLVVGISPGPG
jgi:hypothetical protein